MGYVRYRFGRKLGIDDSDNRLADLSLIPVFFCRKKTPRQNIGLQSVSKDVTSLYSYRVSPQRWHAGVVNKWLFSEVTKQMVAVLVGQFHARDAEGRVYSVHEFQESSPDLSGSEAGSDTRLPVSTYRLAIGDRVTHLGGDDFELLQSGVKMTRTP